MNKLMAGLFSLILLIGHDAGASENSFEWVKVKNGDLPLDSVKLGEKKKAGTNQPVYLCRVKQSREYHVGRLIGDSAFCSYSDTKNSFRNRDFDILVLRDKKFEEVAYWQSAEVSDQKDPVERADAFFFRRFKGSDLALDLVPFTVDASSRNKIFICRTDIFGDHDIGIVKNGFEGCLIDAFGRRHVKKFQIMMMTVKAAD